MKLGSTILFSVAVASSMIGIYQVMVQRDIIGNYWIFMVSFLCLILYRYLNRPVK
jgi:hypothetical protein